MAGRLFSGGTRAVRLLSRRPELLARRGLAQAAGRGGGGANTWLIAAAAAASVAAAYQVIHGVG